MWKLIKISFKYLNKDKLKKYLGRKDYRKFRYNRFMVRWGIPLYILLSISLIYFLTAELPGNPFLMVILILFLMFSFATDFGKGLEKFNDYLYLYKD